MPQQPDEQYVSGAVHEQRMAATRHRNLGSNELGDLPQRRVCRIERDVQRLTELRLEQGAYRPIKRHLEGQPRRQFLLAQRLLQQLQAGWGGMVLAGLLVGYGTRLGCGCTSGHGICGIARLSLRSLAATAVFMAAGVATVLLLRLAGWR